MILFLPEYLVNLTMICLVDGQFLLNLMGVLCASWILMSVSFPRLGKFSAMICSHNPSIPISLSSSSGTPMILMLFLFNESLISLILTLWYFALISLYFFCFVILYKFVLYIADSLFCLIHPAAASIHACISVIAFLISFYFLLLLSLQKGILIYFRPQLIFLLSWF